MARSEKPNGEADEEGERLPEVPPLPEVPKAPALRPNLPRRPPVEEPDSAAEYRRMGAAYTLPMTLVAPIVALTLLGYWLDMRFDKSPYFTLAGALIGTISGFINMIRLANRMSK